MKPTIFRILVAAFLTALLALRFNPETTSSAPLTLKFSRAGCSPDWTAMQSWLSATDIPPIPGAGTHKWKISTKSDSAQFYFNQGINMYYSFHIIESMASFQKAARFDSTCAMVHWAQSLAYGPNINDVGYAASAEAIRLTQKADQLSASATQKEKALIDAIKVRYSADSSKSRETLNRLYTAEMKRVYEAHPNDPDFAALYADAMMLEHPWDLWTNDGKPKPWTPQIREVLEKLLNRTPMHPGANHYYIHVMEPSPYPEKALPSADRLGLITPGLSHTVHMPSHIYLRTGQYTKGVTVNENAVNSYRSSISLFSPVTGNDFLYLIHNLHMKTNQSMMAGDLAYSRRAADETAASLNPDYLAAPGAMGSYMQYILMTPVLIDVRFGQWEALLGRKIPADTMTYAFLLDKFGRGMAYTGLHKLDSAKHALEQLRELKKDSGLAIPLSPFSSALEGATVAEHLLEGSIALEERNFSKAIAAYTAAVDVEKKMVYNEPRDWMINPAPYLGQAFLGAGDAKQAESAFRKDLQSNQDNIWSLEGLHLSLLKQGKKKEAAQSKKRYEKVRSQAVSK